MAIEDNIKITDGTTEIDLVLDADGFQMLASGNKFGVPEHDNLYHDSDWESGSGLIREKTKNRIWPMKLAIRGATDDGVVNNLTALRRMARQASRYQTHKDVTKVYLYLKLYGATYPTYYDIIDIEIDGLDILTYMNRNNQEVIFDDGLSINVITEPLGYGDAETLHNLLPNASFEEDTNSDGLANQWAEVSTPTTSISSTIYLHGHKSQHVVTNGSATQGIRSFGGGDLGAYFVAYAWVYQAGTAEITLRISNYLSDATEIVHTHWADATVTKTDGGGRVWRRLTVAGTFPVADSALVYFRVASSTAADFYVDKVYMEDQGIDDSALVPRAWMSLAQITNLHDPVALAYNGRIDICDVAGDSPAITKYEIVAGSDVTRSFVFHTVGPYKDTGNYTYDQSGTVGIGCLGGQYLGTSVPAAAATTIASVSLENDVATYNSKLAVFARIYDAGANGTLHCRAGITFGSLGPVYYTPYFKVDVQSKWVPQYCGVVDIFDPENIPGTSYPTSTYDTITLTIQAYRSVGATTAVVRVDFVQLYPTGIFICDSRNLTDGSVPDLTVLHLDSFKQVAYGSAGSGYQIRYNTLGRIPALDPIDNNSLFVTHERTTATTDRWPIDTLNDVTITYIPRTETLLGSV